MAKQTCLVPAEIAAHLMFSGVAQPESMRKFFIRMWIQHSALTKQDGIMAQTLLSRLAVTSAEISPHSPSGFTTGIEGKENEPHPGL